MYSTYASPVAPPGVTPWSPLWLTASILHLGLWIMAIVQGALCVQLANDKDSFEMISVAALGSTCATVAFAAIAAVMSIASPGSMGDGMFGYLAAVSATVSAGAFILLLVEVSDMRSAQLSHNLSAAGNVSSDDLYKVPHPRRMSPPGHATHHPVLCLHARAGTSRAALGVCRHDDSCASRDGLNRPQGLCPHGRRRARAQRHVKGTPRGSCINCVGVVEG